MRTFFVTHRRVMVAVAIAWLAVPLMYAESQEYKQAERPNTPGQPTVASNKRTGPIPRMPDGKPDLRGTWTKVGGGIDEANPPNVKFLQVNENKEVAFGKYSEAAGFTGGPSGRGTIGLNSGARAGQRPQHEPNPSPPAGTVDPANGILPWRPEAAQARLERAMKMGPPPESYDYIQLTARCAPPAPWYGQARGSIEIVQRPESVALLYEWDHTNRVIYTDGRPPLGSDVRLFGGDAIGRWEGDTLVVETRNLNGLGVFGQIFQRYSQAMRLTERFTMVSPDLINYEIIFDDPNLFTRPVKSVGYFYPSDDGEEVMEITCHEGSRTLYNIYGF